MLRFSSLFDGTPAADIALDALQEDMRAARLTWQYRFYYQLRPIIPRSLRRILQQRRKVGIDSDCFIPSTFFQKLSEVSSEIPIGFSWPGDAKFAFVLTHDVETKDGLRWISRLADLEEKLGFRSSWNFVPYKYKIDRGLVRDLRRRGFEIGIHGYNHDGKLFSSRRTFDRRAQWINRALEEYRAVGFRAPMMHRNFEWMQDLNIQYDTSCADIDPFQPMPGGVGSIWPFQVGRFVELPYTLPQDHTLFIAHRLRDNKIWRRKLDFLIKHSGMALMTTHPDYLDTEHRFGIYRDFLLHVQNRESYWHATPAAIADWWHKRKNSAVDGAQLSARAAATRCCR